MYVDVVLNRFITDLDLRCCTTELHSGLAVRKIVKGIFSIRVGPGAVLAPANVDDHFFERQRTISLHENACQTRSANWERKRKGAVDCVPPHENLQRSPPIVRRLRYACTRRLGVRGTRRISRRIGPGPLL